MCEFLDAIEKKGIIQGIKQGVEKERIETAKENDIVLNSDNIKGVFGSLNEYANPSLISSEKDAWANAAAEKHSKRHQSIDEHFADFDDKYVASEVDWGHPVGKEIL